MNYFHYCLNSNSVVAELSGSNLPLNFFGNPAVKYAHPSIKEYYTNIPPLELVETWTIQFAKAPTDKVLLQLEKAIKKPFSKSQHTVYQFILKKQV